MLIAPHQSEWSSSLPVCSLGKSCLKCFFLNLNCHVKCLNTPQLPHSRKALPMWQIIWGCDNWCFNLGPDQHSTLTTRNVSTKYEFSCPSQVLKADHCESIWRWGFGRWTSHGDRAYLSIISVLVGKNHREILHLFCVCSYNKKMAIQEGCPHLTQHWICQGLFWLLSLQNNEE